VILTQQECVTPAMQEMVTLLYMNASTVHSTLLYKNTPCSFNVAAKASAGKKQSAVLSDEEVEEHLLLSQSEGTTQCPV
jgi:hypothetical protein